MIYANKIKYGYEGQDHTGKKLFNIQYKKGLLSVFKYTADDVDIEVRYNPKNKSKELKFLRFDPPNKLIFEGPTKSYLIGTHGELYITYTTKDATIVE